MNGYQAPTDRYGNQFATRVEMNTEHGVIFADIVQQSENQMLRLVVGGIVLSPVFDTMDDARDAAEVILGRLVEGELLVESIPVGVTLNKCYNASCSNLVSAATAWFCDSCNDSVDDTYYGERVPTGWDAQDHKALYE